MAYISKEDLKTRLSEDYLLQIADDDGDGVPDDQLINDAIDQAQSEVDAYLGTRYEVPLSDPPQVVKKLTADLTIYYLHARKDNLPDTVQKLYEGAVKLLSLIAQGKVTVGLDAQPEGSGIKVKTRDKVFGSIIDEMP